jgi:hypothetical protein
MAKRILVLSFLILPLLIQAQSVPDSSINLNMFSFHASGFVPGGDIARRYGLNMGVGGSYWFKTRSNWMLSADFSYFSGNKFKEDSILRGVQDEFGYFINSYGEQREVTYYERGYYAGLRGGKLFPVIGPNKNSGIMVTGSVGFLEYKTFFRQEENNIPVITDDYAKMFDYLTNGLALNQFIGYLHLDDKQPLNFYAGFEFYQAWTRCRRDFLYNLQGPENKNRFDMLFGIRVGWIFPVNKKATGTYYYF